MKKVEIFLLIALGILFLLGGCNSPKSKLVGKWRITEMSVDPILQKYPLLVEGSREIALSTTYEINSDMTFCSIISKNDVTIETKTVGTINYKSGSIVFNIEKLYFMKDGEWLEFKRGSINDSFFEPITMKIEESSKSVLKLSEIEGKGKLYYTLEKIN